MRVRDEHRDSGLPDAVHEKAPPVLLGATSAHPSVGRDLRCLSPACRCPTRTLPSNEPVGAEKTQCRSRCSWIYDWSRRLRPHSCSQCFLCYHFHLLPCGVPQCVSLVMNSHPLGLHP